jgi:hypothetical protein
VDEAPFRDAAFFQRAYDAGHITSWNYGHVDQEMVEIGMDGEA